ncbi:MAG: cytochrome c [Halocynthiibacter sp.]|jgi:cytochrome c2
MLKFPNIHKPLLSAFCLAAIASTTPVFAETTGLGRVALPEEVAAWNHDVRPDGLGLPEGSGDVLTGEEVFIEKCAVCHGDFAEGVGRWPVLAGGNGSLTSDRPVKTIGSFWPYLSTVYDYVLRAMPFGSANSLEPDEVYAITAYLLYSNDLVGDDFVLSRENFTEVEMPNVANFYDDDRATTELPKFSAQACMENCKDEVKITKRAAVLDVTPEDEAAEEGTGEAEIVEEAAVENVAEEPVQIAEVDPALIAAGEKSFRQCKACHQVGEGARNRTGPILNGVVGRAAGSVSDFRYSKPMTTAAEDGLIWDDEALSAFLADPRGYMKGTKMSFAGVRKEEDIEGLIAYLRSFEE